MVPTATASGLGPHEAITCFSDPQRRAGHIEQPIGVVTSRDYEGLDINYEHLALTTDPVVAAKVRRAFSDFVQDLCDRLRRHEKACVVTVMPAPVMSSRCGETS